MKFFAFRSRSWAVAMVVVSITGALADRLPVEAARKGNSAEALSLLKKGGPANATAPDGSTALHWAAYHDAVDVTDALLRNSANPNATNHYGITPLALACISGNEQIVQLLLDAGADPNLATPAGETPLMLAARTGVPAVIQRLLSRGADPNAQENFRRQTALMWASAEGHLEAVENLIDSGADPNARSSNGFTPFLFAVRQGHIDIVRELLERGIEVDQRLPNGPSALGLAANNAHYELGAFLLNAGADPNFKWDGHSTLHAITWVRRPGQGSNDPAPPGSGKMSSLDFVRKLVAHGADVNERVTARRVSGVRTVLNMRGATPFLLAARTADAELMRLLAELGADPLLPNDDGTTPLMVAAGVGVHSPGEDPGNEEEIHEAVKVALELGNDPNAVDKRGETAMHGAAYKGATSSVQLLMKHGAKIDVWNRKNRSGWTPLRIATGVYRELNLRSAPETAAVIRDLMEAAGASTELEPLTTVRNVLY